MNNKLIPFLMVLIAVNSQAITLKEAIKGAIQNNPRTAAIGLRMQAMQERKKAQYMDLLPSLNISSSIYQSASQFDGVSERQTSNGLNHNIGVSMNLYNGGADVDALKAAEERVKATDAEFNSSNSRIPNTRGSFAFSVFEAYTGLVESYEQKKFISDLEKKLQFIRKAQMTDEETKTLEQRIADLKTSTVSVDFSIKESQKDFTYFTTLPAPQASEIETLDQLQAGLSIPADADEAFDTALKLSPDIQSINHRLAAETYERSSEKKRTFRPRVDVSASYSDSQMNGSGGMQTHSQGSYIGLRVSYSIGAGAYYRNSAGAKELEATRSERDATLLDVQYSLNSRYQTLENLERVFNLQQQNLKKADARLNEIFVKIEKNETVQFKDIMAAVDTRSGYWQSNLQLKRNLVAMRFNLQRTVGTLFIEAMK